jgi:hypothetical protein
VQLAAAVDDLAGGPDLVVDRERRVRVEAETSLVADLVLAERGAVRLAGVLRVRRRPGDDRRRTTSDGGRSPARLRSRVAAPGRPRVLPSCRVGLAAVQSTVCTCQPYAS